MVDIEITNNNMLHANVCYIQIHVTFKKSST